MSMTTGIRRRWWWGLAALALSGSTALAEAAEGTFSLWPPSSFGAALVSTVAFGVVGIALAVGGFKVFDALIKYDLEKEICEKQNVAVAILSAGVILGICLIVAAVVHG